MDEGAALKLIYTDFTKAFDTLQSEFSLAKLIQIGWLCARSQRLKMGFKTMNKDQGQMSAPHI